MEDYKVYSFMLGESPARHYKGHRLSPKEGFEFSLRIYKQLCEVLFQESDTALFDANKSTEYNGMQLLGRLDVEKIIESYNFIIHNDATQITANVDKKQKYYVLSNEKMYGDWFEMYPEDMMEVMLTCIWENVSPFLPLSMQGQIQAVKAALSTPSQEATKEQLSS